MPAIIMKLRVTGAAAGYAALPAWLAVTEQVPEARMIAAVPLTEHTVADEEARLTGSPELAVAPRATDATPTTTLLSGGKVMVWVVAATVNVCVIGVAAR
jgi:hypothetical protein